MNSKKIMIQGSMMVMPGPLRKNNTEKINHTIPFCIMNCRSNKKEKKESNKKVEKNHIESI
jgi:hypothetical protein